MKNSLADIFVRAAVNREALFPVAIIFSWALFATVYHLAVRQWFFFGNKSAGSE